MFTSQDIINIVNKYCDDLINVKKNSKSTVRVYKSEILSFFNKMKFFCLSDIESTSLHQYLNKISKSYDYKASTFLRKYSIINTFFHYLNSKGYVFPKQECILSINNHKKKLPKIIDNSDIILMYNHLKSLKDKCLYDFQMYVMFNLFLFTGLRLTELINLKKTDIIHKEDVSFLFIVGKGEAERLVPIKNELKILLLELTERTKKYKINNMFINIKSNKPFNDRYIQRFFEKLSNKLNLKTKVTPHKFRHTFACNLLNSGSTLVEVQKLLGHSDINTTLKYTYIVDKKLDKCIQNLNTVDLS